MKTLVAVAIFVMCVNQMSEAQSDSIVLKKFYHTWIISQKGHKGKSGILYEVKDSSVMVSNSPRRADYYNGNFYVSTFDVRDIDAIKVRRQGNGFAMLVGGITGVVVGGFISAAYMKHLEETMNEFAYVFGGFIKGVFPLIVSTGIGVGIGALMSQKKTIPIRGSQEQFNRNRNRLNEYALTSNSFPELASRKGFTKYQDSVVDIDGNMYHTLALGGQVWMAENLKVTRYRDGAKIEDAPRNGSISGRQYSWFAVNDNRKLCPAGWHIPSLSDWNSLCNSLGGEGIAGTKLEESFSTNGPTGQWWSSTAMDASVAQSFYLNNKTFGVMLTGVAKTSGLSVRCMRGE